MSDSNDNRKDEPSQEDRLVEALKVLLKDFPDYDPPRIRMDGDIVIPLDVMLKKTAKLVAAWLMPLAV